VRDILPTQACGASAHTLVREAAMGAFRVR